MPRRRQSPKSYFQLQGQYQGHKIIDLVVIGKGVISGVCMPNLKSISYGSKVIAKVKVDNRQTNKQTNKQTDKKDKNNMHPIILWAMYNDYKDEIIMG